MYRIIVQGPAGESNIDDRSRLDGINCDDEFSEYFHKAWNIGGKKQENQQCLIDKGVAEGYMSFRWIAKKDKKEKDNHKDVDPYGEENWTSAGKLYVRVEYTSEKELNEDELEVLKKYTQGQMSDGIGEGFEQFPCMYDGEEEIFLSPWFRGQILTTIQTEI